MAQQRNSGSIVIVHHQTAEVLDALAQHQLAIFVGARGTGKTCLIADVRATLESRSVNVLVLDAASAQAAIELVAPLAGVLECPSDRLTAANMPDELRLRVLVDNCDTLHEKTWFPAVQDEWRGLLGETPARGRVAFLLCGRPLFRRVAEGRGSPLVGIGTFIPSRPLSAAEIEASLGVDQHVAEKCRVKTGGHPQLTHRLVEAIEGDLARLETHYADFARTQRRYLLQLIEDHGSAARGVLADLLDSPRSTQVADSALIARHFGGSRVLGQDTLDDLAASGLVEHTDQSCRLGAEILRTDRDLRQHLAAPPFAIVDVPSDEFADVAAHLFRLENWLRRYVGTALSQVEETWWPSRFPAALVREVEQRRRDEADSPSPSPVEIHPLAYLSLGELIDSMLEDSNWEEVFRIRLGMSREAFTKLAGGVKAVRNKVAHNRPVGEVDLTLLRLASERLNS